ncbi:MAG: small basic protein [Candidatus Omnitrophica bacterium]|nr:small basic protein [Candidatus Omnitrophota bacterium]
MSIHSSLRTPTGVTASLRNVLKRFERVRHLMTQGAWPEGRSVYGLPKIKQVKLKVRKAAAKEKEEAPAEAPATGAAPSSSSS